MIAAVTSLCFFLLTVTCEMMHLGIDHRKTLGQVSEHLY